MPGDRICLELILAFQLDGDWKIDPVEVDDELPEESICSHIGGRDVKQLREGLDSLEEVVCEDREWIC